MSQCKYFPLHNKSPVTSADWYLSNNLLLIYAGSLNVGTNIKTIPETSCTVICSDQNSEQSVLGWLDNKEGSNVDECEDFALHSNHDSVSEVCDNYYEQFESDSEEEHTTDGLSSECYSIKLCCCQQLFRFIWWSKGVLSQSRIRQL
jgi:hypothetical protein